MCTKLAVVGSVGLKPCPQKMLMHCLVTMGSMKCFSVMKKQHLYVLRISLLTQYKEQQACDIWTKKKLICRQLGWWYFNVVLKMMFCVVSVKQKGPCVVVGGLVFCQRWLKPDNMWVCKKKCRSMLFGWCRKWICLYFLLPFLGELHQFLFYLI